MTAGRPFGLHQGRHAGRGGGFELGGSQRKHRNQRERDADFPSCLGFSGAILLVGDESLPYVVLRQLLDRWNLLNELELPLVAMGSRREAGPARGTYSCSIPELH